MDHQAAPPRRARARRALVLAGVAMATVLGSCAESSPLLAGTAGPAESAPFPLRGGRYLLGWTAAPAPGDGCSVMIEIVDEAERRTLKRLEAEIPPGGRVQDAEPLRFLPSGTYRLAGESTCRTWTAVIGEDRVGGRD
jgi:hypothetical protein